MVAALLYFAASLEALSQWTPIRKIQPTEWDSYGSEQKVGKNSVLKCSENKWAGTIQQLNSKQSSITVDSYTQQWTDGWQMYCLHKYLTGDGDAFTNQREATKLHKALNRNIHDACYLKNVRLWPMNESIG